MLHLGDLCDLSKAGCEAFNQARINKKIIICVLSCSERVFSVLGKLKSVLNARDHHFDLNRVDGYA